MKTANKSSKKLLRTGSSNAWTSSSRIQKTSGKLEIDLHMASYCSCLLMQFVLLNNEFNIGSNEKFLCRNGCLRAWSSHCTEQRFAQTGSTARTARLHLLAW